MKFLPGSTLLFLISMALISGCSILKGEDPEKKVRDFLTTFQGNLTKSDDEILAAFKVEQSREALLSVIAILQNKDPFVVCESTLANATISIEKEVVTVEIPTLFRLKELSSTDTASFTLVLWLKPTQNSFVITGINGEEFYQEFQQIKNMNQWEAEQKLALKERLWIYEKAKNLEAKYDSVIWYTVYAQQNYFYVVNGDWQNYFLSYETRNEKNRNVLMGLADANGELIIPMEYELIGTIAFQNGDLVEVTKNGKHGYFNVETKQLVIEPVYDVIIPYGREDAWALVKQDSTYGWLDDKFNYTPGFVSQRMEEWFNNFEYLRQTIKLAPGQYSFCEIPSPKSAGNGIIIPPSYLSSHGIFEQIEGGISTTTVPVSAWTEYKETVGSFIESIGTNLRAVVTTIRERYLEGREEFYTSSMVAFVDDQQNTLGTASIAGEDVSMHPIDSTLLEVRTPHDYWFMENDVSEENNLMAHEYFSISTDRQITKLKSSRLYPQTQFVKMDSSYLVGSFTHYNPKLEQEEKTTFLSIKTITYMRDEILAANGYSFPELGPGEYFTYLHDGEHPRYTTIEEVTSAMSDIDKHNLAFLNRVLALLQPAA